MYRSNLIGQDPLIRRLLSRKETNERSSFEVQRNWYSVDSDGRCIGESRGKLNYESTWAFILWEEISRDLLYENRGELSCVIL